MKRPPRIVIVGAAGRLGQALQIRLSRDAEVVGLARPGIDLSSPRSIREALDPLDFDRLILPAAMTAVDACESSPEHAFAINAEAPGLIAGICAEKGAHLTHFSTDFVFDGAKAGPYSEDDAPRPLGVYGASKLRGEELVLAADPGHLVVRVSWLYGPGKPAFPEWIVDKACAESSLALPADKIGCPALSTDVAELLLPLLALDGDSPAGGVFHLCNSGASTWRDWGQACIDLAREAGAPVRVASLAANTLADIPAFLAKRPPNSALDIAKYSAFTGIVPRPWREALRAHIAADAFLAKYRAAACG
jgi:dTDP-4-dehydrorhamnose reductase